MNDRRDEAGLRTGNQRSQGRAHDGVRQRGTRKRGPSGSERSYLLMKGLHQTLWRRRMSAVGDPGASGASQVKRR